MNAVDRQMTAGVEDGVFPGGVLLVSEGRKVLFHRAYGVTNIFTGESVRTDTVFDLASLTKPLATAVALMKLMTRGAVALDAPWHRFFPSSRSYRKARDHHRAAPGTPFGISGLPAFLPDPAQASGGLPGPFS